MKLPRNYCKNTDMNFILQIINKVKTYEEILIKINRAVDHFVVKVVQT